MFADKTVTLRLFFVNINKLEVTGLDGNVSYKWP